MFSVLENVVASILYHCNNEMEKDPGVTIDYGLRFEEHKEN